MSMAEQNRQQVGVNMPGGLYDGDREHFAVIHCPLHAAALLMLAALRAVEAHGYFGVEAQVTAAIRAAGEAP